MANIDYCSKLYQQQIGSARWNRHDDLLGLLHQSPENYMQYLPRGAHEEIVVCKYADIQNESILALASRTGRVELHDTKNKGILYNFWPMGGPIYDMAWVPGKLQILVPSKHAKVKLWDASGAKVREIFDFMQYSDNDSLRKEPVTSIDVCKEDPHVFATGGADNIIFLWDMRTKGKISTICRPHKRKNVLLRRTVAGLAFRDRNSIISCGENDDFIKMWDFRSLKHNRPEGDTRAKNIFTYKGELSEATGIGFSSITLDGSSRMYVNCTDHNIYCYNISNSCPSEPIMKYKDFRTTASVIPQNVSSHTKLAVSNDGNYIICGSRQDACAYVWNTNFSYPIVRLNHMTPVTYVAWEQTNNFDHTVITCSGYKQRTIWRLKLGSPESRVDKNLPFYTVDLLPLVRHQMRLRDLGTFMDKSVKACRRCFSASVDVYCRRCNAGQKLRNFYTGCFLSDYLCIGNKTE